MRIVIVLLECKVEGDRGTDTEGVCQRWNLSKQLAEIQEKKESKMGAQKGGVQEQKTPKHNWSIRASCDYETRCSLPGHFHQSLPFLPAKSEQPQCHA